LPTVAETRALRKFTKDGVFVKSWGQKGNAQGQFADVDSIVVDARGNVYAADAGNGRIQVFDNNGTYQREIANVGNAQAMCITPGANQVMFVSNSNPPNDLDKAGEIYKMRLDGTIVGKFGRAGKLLKEFGSVSAIDCRSENTLYVGEVGNFRVQKLTMRLGELDCVVGLACSASAAARSGESDQPLARSMKG
jgi:hypothetical protein